MQVVSASLVTSALQQVQEDGLFRQKRLHNLFRSAKSTYVVLRGRGRGQLEFLRDMPPPPTCNVTRLRPRGGSTAVLRVECMSRQRYEATVCGHCGGTTHDREDAANTSEDWCVRRPARRLAHRVEALPCRPLCVVRRLPSAPLRSPLVNIPVGACADPAASDSVFQAQRFVDAVSALRDHHHDYLGSVRIILVASLSLDTPRTSQESPIRHHHRMLRP